MWTGEATKASIFPSYAQYRIRSQTGQTYKFKMNKMTSQTSILDLPPEILRMIFQRVEFETTEDLRNFLKACEDYTDPRIFNILSQIHFENEGILF